MTDADADAPRRHPLRADLDRFLAHTERGAHPPYSAIELAIVVLLLTGFVACAVPLVLSQSAAYDEGPHILSGYQYLVSGRFSGGIGNPPLAQVALAAATVFRAAAYRPFDPAVLPYARLVVLLCACLTAMLVWRGGRRHGGPIAGVAGLLLFVAEPTVLAHSTLATVDVIAMSAATLATYALWRAAARPTLSAVLLAGVAVGAALATKFSLLAFLPAWALAAVWPVGARTPAPTPSRLRMLQRIATQALSRSVAMTLVIGLAWATLCTVYLWRGVFSSSVLAGGPLGPLLGFLPEQFVHSLARVGQHALGGHFAYLCGARSATGFPQYFVIAACVKWTLPFLLLLSLGGALLVQRGRWPVRGEMFLLVPPVALFLMVSLVSRVDIGIRHLLPIMPLLAELGGVTVAALARSGRYAAVLALVLVGAHGVEGVLARSHPLAYFNELAGGAARGDRFLIDSNIDWGTEESAVRDALAADSSLVLLPDPRDPAPGRVLVNVNSLRGLFDLSGTPYWWLVDLPLDSLVSPAWRVYRVTREMPPPATFDTAHRALFLAATAPRPAWARVVVDPAASSPDPHVRRDALLVQARASRAIGDDAAAREAVARARPQWDDRFAAERARLDERAARERGDDGHAAYYRARVLSLTGDHQGALLACRESLRFPSSAHAALYALALETLHQGQLAATDSLLAAGARPPDGTVHALADQVRAARRLRGSPHARDHVELARWFLGRGAPDAAFDEAEVALALDEASEDAIALLGSLAVDEKCGRLVMERHGARRGFALSALRQQHRARLVSAWETSAGAR